MLSSGQPLAYIAIKSSPANLVLPNHGTFASNVAAEEDSEELVQQAWQLAFYNKMLLTIKKQGISKLLMTTSRDRKWISNAWKSEDWSRSLVTRQLSTMLIWPCIMDRYLPCLVTMVLERQPPYQCSLVSSSPMQALPRSLALTFLDKWMKSDSNLVYARNMMSSLSIWHLKII